MKKAKVGDIFEISILKNLYGYGQIINKYKEDLFLFVIYSLKNEMKNDIILKNVISSEIVFIGNTFDTKITNNQWNVLGNTLENINIIPLPKYKIKMNDVFYVEDYFGLNRREATENELNILPFRKGVAPIRLEKALKALWQIIPWEDTFNELKFSNHLQSSAITI